MVWCGVCVCVCVCVVVVVAAVAVAVLFDGVVGCIYFGDLFLIYFLGVRCVCVYALARGGGGGGVTCLY